MQAKSRQELYRSFVEFVRNDVQQERYLVNRRMFNVFFWCFMLPAILSVSVIMLVKLNVLPRSARSLLDWMVLVFPVCYSLYILGSEVLAEVPTTFRKGGLASSLGHSLKEGEWRDRVCDSMARNVDANHEDWIWINESFKMDLASMQYRTKYLTALAGAVFFLIMQGIDSITDAEPKFTMIKSSIGWVETSTNDLSQFVGLGLFLILLFLSGNQTYYSLLRYKNCAELILVTGEEKIRKS